MTPEQVAEQRAAVVKESLEYAGTPYHHAAQVKGPSGGVDCATLLLRVFIDTGVVEPFTLEEYSPQWHLHRNAERYMSYILERAIERPADYTPQPGDIALWLFGRVFSHGGIVVEWPNVIHSWSIGKCCQISDVTNTMALAYIGEGALVGKKRPMKIYTIKSWLE